MVGHGLVDAAAGAVHCGVEAGMGGALAEAGGVWNLADYQIFK